MDVNYRIDNCDEMNIAVNWWSIKSIGVANQLYIVCTENGPGVMEVIFELMIK